jgi:glycosyltransferase involved in cell wall biosynthesis
VRHAGGVVSGAADPASVAPGRAASSAPAPLGGGGAGEPVLRVLYVIGYPQRMAGAPRSLLELVRHLPAHVQPHVLVMGEGPVADAFRQAGLPVSVITPRGALGRHGGALFRTSLPQRARIAAAELLPITRQVRRLLRELGIGLVHVNEARAALLAVPAARLARIPVVAHLRGEMPLGRAGRFLFEAAADRIITVSDGVRDTLSAGGRRKASTVYNGTRVPPAGPPPPPWVAGMRARGALVVCCFASVVPFKGHHHLVRAVAELNRRGWRTRAVFLAVGDFPEGSADYQAWLGELCRELGVDNLTFAGWQADPFPFYHLADVTVLPSVSHEALRMPGRTLQVRGSEGFPRTHLEAMALGIPVVGTRIAGVPEQVADGETGRVVPPSDPVALADALEQLLASEPLRRRMGSAARVRALERFSTAAYVAGVCREYDRVLGRRDARGS